MQKQIIRFLRTYRLDWWGILLYTAASHPIDSAVFKPIANTYYNHILPICKQGRLITGDDLIQTFHLKEGKQIGDVLREIEERQFDGDIRTREEAFLLSPRHLSDVRLGTNVELQFCLIFFAAISESRRVKA